MTLTKVLLDTGATEVKNFKLTGEISDRFLFLSARNTNRKKIGFHTELLELVGGGDIMKGYCLWYSVTGQHIQSDEIIWKRS